MGNRPKGEPPAYRPWRRRGTVVGYATYQNERIPFPGPYNSPESRQAYERWRAEWVRLNGVQAPQPPKGCEVAELVAAFLDHAGTHYRRPDGTPTSETVNYKLSLRFLLRRHATTPVNDFTPLDLEAVRDLMLREPITRTLADGSEKLLRVGLSRGVVNQYTGRIVRVFVWGMGRGLLKPETVTALKGLQPLARGRSLARETPRVLPVTWATVEATLPWLASAQLRAMVLLQWWTGCRPGQACAIQGEDVYQAGTVTLGRKTLAVPEGMWLWVIDAKMAHLRGDEDREEFYFLGEPGKAVVGPWLRPGYLFCPREAQPHQAMRVKKGLGPSYQRTSYSHAIRDALKKAGSKGEVIPRWHPHMIRHAVAARVQAAAGLEAARAVLNHRGVDQTVEYSQRDTALAAEAIRALGG